MKALARLRILHMLYCSEEVVAPPRALKRDRALYVGDLLVEHMFGSAATAALVPHGVLDHELREHALFLCKCVLRDATQERCRHGLLTPLGARVSAAVCYVAGDAAEER